MFCERLYQLRNELGYTKRDLVKKLPLNYSTYANYESGLRVPSFEVLQHIASFYKVSIDFILGLTDNRKRIDDVLNITDVEYDHINSYRNLDDHGQQLVDFILKMESERVNPPVRAEEPDKTTSPRHVALQVYNQRASAGLGNYLDDYSDTDFEMRRFVADAISLKADFAVRLHGDSMEPQYSDNDVVCVKSTPKIDSSQIGIFIYEGEAYCKKLKIDRRRGEIYLESLNKEYPPLSIYQPDQLKTVGLVLGVGKEKK